MIIEQMPTCKHGAHDELNPPQLEHGGLMNISRQHVGAHALIFRSRNSAVESGVDSTRSVLSMSDLVGEAQTSQSLDSRRGAPLGDIMYRRSTR